MTAWANSTLAPAIGVVGPTALTDRLGCNLRVRRFVPRDAPVGEVDAVLVARSALAAGGSWAGALRPVGFDRGVALAALLSGARARAVPVVLLEDLPAAALDGWHKLLDGAVDDALSLGPLGAGGLGWHPGEHWDAAALRLAVARTPGTPVDSWAASPAVARHDWRAAQRQGAVRGRVELEATDPWSRHLAGELVGLGADVRDSATGAPVPRDGATPAAAAAWLCARLGLSEPAGPPAPDKALLLRGNGSDDREAAACLDALDRVCKPSGLVVRVGAAFGATADVVGAVTETQEDGHVHATALDLGALA